MSFRCESCKFPQPTRTKPLLAVESRRVEYREPWSDIIIGIGHETVRERKLCAGCHEEWTRQPKEAVQ